MSSWETPEKKSILRRSRSFSSRISSSRRSFLRRIKYLARSAEILQSLNSFIKEVLLVSHVDMQAEPAMTTVDLSRLLAVLTADYMRCAVCRTAR